MGTGEEIGRWRRRQDGAVVVVVSRRPGWVRLRRESGGQAWWATADGHERRHEKLSAAADRGKS